MSTAFERPPRELSLQIPSDADVDSILNPPTPILLVPCLKGKMFYEGGTVHCKGLWAMSEQAHSQPSQCSDFEFKLVKADDDGVGSFPINGRYQGWFQLKQPPPQKGSVRIEDKEIILTFSEYSSADGELEEKSMLISHSVTGHGTNKFGSFNLHGTLDEEVYFIMVLVSLNLTLFSFHVGRNTNIPRVFQSYANARIECCKEEECRDAVSLGYSSFKKSFRWKTVIELTVRRQGR